MTERIDTLGAPPVRYAIENPNCMNRFVQWFRDDEASTILKILVLVLPLFALVGVGLLVADPIVALLLTVLPAALFGLWALREHCVLNRSEEQAASDEEAQSPDPLPASILSPAQPMLSRTVAPASALIPAQPAPPKTASLFERLAWAFGGQDKLAKIQELEEVSQWLAMLDTKSLTKTLNENSLEAQPAPAENAPLSAKVAWAFGGEDKWTEFLDEDLGVELADVKEWLDTTISEILAGSEEAVHSAPPPEIESAPVETGSLAEKLAWAFGGEDKLMQFPVLDLNVDAVWHKVGPKAMSAPIMRGVKGGSPFYVIRIKHNHLEYGGDFAIFFYQAVIAGKECWRHAVRGTLYQNPFSYLSLQQKDWELIHQIVALKNHPQLSLI